MAWTYGRTLKEDLRQEDVDDEEEPDFLLMFHGPLGEELFKKNYFIYKQRWSYTKTSVEIQEHKFLEDLRKDIEKLKGLSLRKDRELWEVKTVWEPWDETCFWNQTL